jgi:hypothetical protein
VSTLTYRLRKGMVWSKSTTKTGRGSGIAMTVLREGATGTGTGVARAGIRVEMWIDTTAAIGGGGVETGMDTLEEVVTGEAGAGAEVGAEIIDQGITLGEEEVAVGIGDGGGMTGILDMRGEIGIEILKLIPKLHYPQPKMS